MSNGNASTIVFPLPVDMIQSFMTPKGSDKKDG
jgi:hypothetical protein